MTEALRDIAEDCTMVGGTLLLGADRATTPNTDLLQALLTLQHLTGEAIAAVVVRQRAQDKPLADLAPIADLTEDRLRKKYNPRLVDRALATRRRPQPATTAHHTAATDAPTLRRPGQRLSCALNRMKNGSGRSQRQIAQIMGVDESYVSRLLSGQRALSWRHVKAICEACGTDPERMKPLWEAAATIQPSNNDDPVRYLHTYLQGLHYALGSPASEAITQHTISADDLHHALHGPGVPDWPVIDRLTLALQSVPAIARPLWRRARLAAEK
ncbi:helix-turn-helix transcriptional regulator, partial [Streptomyces sp. NPDC051129]